MADLCGKRGQFPTVYMRKAKSGGMEVSEAQRLKIPEDESAKLKQMLANAMLDNVALKGLASATSRQASPSRTATTKASTAACATSS